MVAAGEELQECWRVDWTDLHWPVLHPVHPSPGSNSSWEEEELDLDLQVVEVELLPMGEEAFPTQSCSHYFPGPWLLMLVEEVVQDILQVHLLPTVEEAGCH